MNSSKMVEIINMRRVQNIEEFNAKSKYFLCDFELIQVKDPLAILP